MIFYTCKNCEEIYPDYEMHTLPDEVILCDDCYWSDVWEKRKLRKFKKRKDPKKPVLDLIDRLQGEAGYASHGEPYATIYSAMDVHLILNEIQQAVEDMEV